MLTHADCQTAATMQFMMPQGSRSRLRRDEMRTIVAHIYRLVATDLRPGALQEDATLRSKLTDWIVDTLKYLQSAAAGLSVITLYLTTLFAHCIQVRSRVAAAFTFMRPVWRYQCLQIRTVKLNKWGFLLKHTTHSCPCRGSQV